MTLAAHPIPQLPTPNHQAFANPSSLQSNCAACIFYKQTSATARLRYGVLFGLTDYAYWLYVTDLGVDREYMGQGIGRRLMKAADDVMQYNHIEWTTARLR